MPLAGRAIVRTKKGPNHLKAIKKGSMHERQQQSDGLPLHGDLGGERVVLIIALSSPRLLLVARDGRFAAFYGWLVNVQRTTGGTVDGSGRDEQSG